MRFGRASLPGVVLLLFSLCAFDCNGNGGDENGDQQQEEVESITITAFNIQVFGETKAGKPDVMSTLAQIAQEFDVMVVQEIRNADMIVADQYLARINQDADPDYAMYEGPREGRTSSKEQYVVYYRTPLVEFMSASVYQETNDEFEREPLIVTLKAAEFDFTLIICHIKPDSADIELGHMATVATSVLAANPDEQDIILLGDFNADGSYWDEDKTDHPLKAAIYHWVIGNEWDTTVAANDYTYDRIILTPATHNFEYVTDSAAVFYFDQEYGLTDHDFVEDVSDHYPVFARFRISGPDDDGN